MYTPNQLARFSLSKKKNTSDINISIADAQALTDRCQTLPTPTSTHPMTQSAAVLVRHSLKTSTKCSSLDKVLEGGISRGHILELSGPPGTAKEQLLMNIVAAFVEINEEVIFIGRYSTLPTYNPYKLVFHYLRLPKYDQPCKFGQVSTK
jgi:predicted ATP-dependent serine protease